MHAIDSSLLYALFNEKDKWHKDAKALIQEHRPILIPPGVLQETLDLLRYRHGSQVANDALQWLWRTGQILVDDPSHAEASFQFALQARVSPNPEWQAFVAAIENLSFADLWCITHAIEHKATLLTKDKKQFDAFQRWRPASV